MKLSEEQVKRLKGEGFLINRGTDSFSARIITRNGCLTAEQMQDACTAASEFGDGTIAITGRMTIELPGIGIDKIPSFKAYLEKQGLTTGGTGPKVRPIVSCKGTTCTFGLYDTQALALKIHERFYEGYRSVVLPHKFKIACGGCPNNCVKPDLNDFGIVGNKVLELDESLCRGCKVCNAQKNCPIGAMEKDGKASIDEQKCNHCGRCIAACPFGAIKDLGTRFSVYLGGRWGKQVRIGSRLDARYTEKEVLSMIEKAILLFKRDGIKGERFSSLVERMGLAATQALLESDELLEQKDAILGQGR